MDSLCYNETIFLLEVSAGMTVDGVGEGEEVIPVITARPFWWIERMMQLRLTPQTIICIATRKFFWPSDTTLVWFTVILEF